AFSPIAPVQAFGIVTGAGSLFCMVWSLTVIPALLALGKPERFVAPRRPTEKPGSRKDSVFGAFADLVVRHRRKVLAAALIFLVMALLALLRLGVQDSWSGGFSPEGCFYRGTEAFNRQFFGTHLLQVLLDTGHEVLRGELSAEHVDHHEVSLPRSLVKD